LEKRIWMKMNFLKTCEANRKNTTKIKVSATRFYKAKKRGRGTKGIKESPRQKQSRRKDRGRKGLQCEAIFQKDQLWTAKGAKRDYRLFVCRGIRESGHAAWAKMYIEQMPREKHEGRKSQISLHRRQVPHGP